MEKGVNIPLWLKKTDVGFCPCCAVGRGRGFIEKNIEAITSFLKEVLEPEIFSDKRGLLQAIDPRARLFGALLFIVSAALLKTVLSITGLLFMVAAMSLASRINVIILFKRTLPVLAFTLFLVLPTAFNFITPGAVIVKIFSFNDFDLYISRQGLENISVLLLRVAAMASILSLFILTTGYPDMFRALRSFPIPKFFITALSMTFRYIMVLIKVAEDSHMARKARTIKSLTVKEGQGWLASQIWLIMQRSMEIAEGVSLAMTARGFTGEVKTMSSFKMRGWDYIWIGFSIFVLLLSAQA